MTGFFIFIFLAAFALSLFVHLPSSPAPATAPEETENEPIIDYDRLSLLRAAFRDLSPNSLGHGSVDFLNLATMIQKLEAGEPVPAGIGAFILSRIPGGSAWAEKAKEIGA